MDLNVAESARLLGLHNVRAWHLRADEPLLSGEGIGEDDLARLRARHEIPVPAGYRQLLAALGYPDTVPAGEKSRQVAATRGFRSRGPIIDAVSVATLCYGGGIGLHRVETDVTEFTLTVTRATGAERIVPAFTAKEKTVPAGDLVYGIRPGDTTPDDCGFESFAWLGRRDCDAAARQLTETDRAGVIVVLGCPGDSADHTAGIGDLLSDVIGMLRPDISMTQLDKPDKS